MNQYIKPDTKIEKYDPCPRFLSEINISSTAKLVYTALLGRISLSKENGVVDEQGNLYVVYTIKNIAKFVNRSETTISNVLNELEEADLIERRTIQAGLPSHIYVKWPTTEEILSSVSRKPATGSQENYSRVPQKTKGDQSRKVETNKIDNKNKDNIIKKFERDGRL